jgi:hypothetical protein
MKGETLWIVVGVGCLVVIVLGVFGAGGAAIYMLQTGDELGVPVPPLPPPEASAPIAPTPHVAPVAPSPPPLPTPPVTAAPPEPVRVVRATVTASSGLPDVTLGTPCVVEVRPSDDTELPCRAQIDCGPRHLYGSESLGYFACTLAVGTRPDVQGEDPLTTSEDRDPAMSLDTVAGTLSIRDDATSASGAFSLAANVESVAYAEDAR